MAEAEEKKEIGQEQCFQKLNIKDNESKVEEKNTEFAISEPKVLGNLDEDTAKLLKIFPERVWEKIADNITSSVDRSNFEAASPFFQELLQDNTERRRQLLWGMFKPKKENAKEEEEKDEDQEEEEKDKDQEEEEEEEDACTFDCKFCTCKF